MSIELTFNVCFEFDARFKQDAITKDWSCGMWKNKCLEHFTDKLFNSNCNPPKAHSFTTIDDYWKGGKK